MNSDIGIVESRGSHWESLYPDVGKRYFGAMDNPWSHNCAVLILPFLELSKSIEVIYDGMDTYKDKRIHAALESGVSHGEVEKLEDECDLARDHFLVAIYIEIYASIESAVLEFCRKSGEAHRIKVTDMSDKGVTRSKKYLTKVLDNQYEFDRSAHWIQMQHHDQIRNCLVHNNGKINGMSNEKVIREAVSKTKSVRVDRDKIVVTRDTCDELLEIGINLVAGLIVNENKK